MQRIKIKELLKGNKLEQEVQVMGWVRTFRSNRFIAINDGSVSTNIQAVINFEEIDEVLLKQITTGSSISIHGRLIKSQGKGQPFEIAVSALKILGNSNQEEYPLQPKKHSLEFLREIAHLRARTATFGAIYRLRHQMIYGVHTFFHEKNFINVHTPIITGLDAEGAGEMFKVTSLDLENIPKNKEGKVDHSKDFFGCETNLTVSGQLEGETAALALSDIYTFGPTFRAEKSNTSRHLAEFWMVEPEMAFYNLQDSMVLAESFIKYLINHALTHCREDLNLLDKRAADEDKMKPSQERNDMSLIERLEFVTAHNFEKITYTQAIEILKNSKPNKKKKFKYIINQWGADLQSEHERFLVEKHFKKPVIIYDYPASIKAFYMRLNEDDKTVAAMDVLFPTIGEIIGGSQREERYEVLKKRMNSMNIEEKHFLWYLDTRKFGTAPHSGFGLGFERLIQFITGMGNIRDVIPFPRTPSNASF